MVGVPYNPSNCAFIANQALNANQFNGNVNYSTNNTTHLTLWDFVEQKIYWVNSQTNIIEAEIPGASACDFFADITYVGTVTPPQLQGQIGVQAVENYYQYTCTPTNGSAPYTYDWSIETAPATTFAIVGSSTSQSVVLNNISQFGGASGLIRCEVTDAEGCITQAYFLAYVQALL